MIVYKIKHTPTGLYYNGLDDEENSIGKTFDNKTVAVGEFYIWVNIKFAQGVELSDWELEELDYQLRHPPKDFQII